MSSDAPNSHTMDQSENYLPQMMFVPNNQIMGPSQAQRVPVAPSMLFTYAHMRGRNQHYFDPLHHALYPASDRQRFNHRMWLPPIAKRASLEGLPRGATFFWDPITAANLLPPQLLPPALHGGSYQPRREQQSQLTYNEYIRQNPPAIGNNHYKGDMVWANFGYYLAEGKWIDPESEGELYEAYMNQPSSHGAEPHLPDIPRSRDHGPRILTPQELNEVYQDFAADVADEHDAEGDPRDWRISPETFAQWAAGAVTGDKYEETVMKTPENHPTVRRSVVEKCKIPIQSRPEMQFDLETGSALSGVYEIERSPSLLSSPLGVDIVRPPPYFSYSYPGIMDDLERHAFGAAWGDRRQRGSVIESTASTPEVFTSERARENLTRPKDALDGARMYETVKDNICRIREEGQRVWQENMAQLQEAQEFAERRIEIYRQIHFLKEYLENNSMSGPRMKIPATLKDIPRAPTPPTPTPKRTQYRRYIDEAEEQETIQLIKAKLLGARLKTEYETLQDDVEPREKQRLQLLDRLGIQNVDEIPGLMPDRKLFEKPRVQIGQ